MNFRCPTAESIQRSGIELRGNFRTAQVRGNATFHGATCLLAAVSSKWGAMSLACPSLRWVVVTVLAVWLGIVRIDRQNANQEFN